MIVFMGTPEFAVPILQMLIDKGYPVGLVVTQPDKKVGRKQTIEYSPVKQLALENNLNIFQPHKMKDEYEYIIEKKPKLIITAAYGQILPKALLENIPAINIHGSLLPKYRGGAPIQYALFNAEEKTGVTLMEMVYKMDAGNMIAKAEVMIEKQDNYQTLSEKLSLAGRKLLETHLDDILNNNYTSEKQEESQVTFAYTIKKEEEMIDWNQESKFILGRIRGLSPNVGAYTTINQIQLKIYEAKKSDIIVSTIPGVIKIENKSIYVATKDGSIELLRVQQQGRKKLAAKEFLNGQNILKDKDQFE